MNDTKRRKFTRDDVQMRLSRRRFALTATGAVLFAYGGRKAWAAPAACVKCDNTAKVFKDLTITQIFGESSSGGYLLSAILSKAIHRFEDPEKQRLVDFRDHLQERDDRADGPAICYRDFFVTPRTTNLDEVLEALVPDDINDSDLRGRLKNSMKAACEFFQVPMWELPSDHDPTACQNLLDGWTGSESDVAGVLKTFENDTNDDAAIDTRTLDAILAQPPDYTNSEVPWRWRAHLLQHLALFGMTSMSGGAPTCNKHRHERLMGRGLRARGANQCAYLGTDGKWYCGPLTDAKCTLQGGQPSEGSDLCNPPPG